MASKQRIVASTKVYSNECIYTWTIENYRLLKFKVGQIFESPKFGVGSDDKKYFQLLLYPEGDNAESAGYISLFLEPVFDPKNKPLELVCRWTLSAINDTKVIKKGHYVTILRLPASKAVMKKIDDLDVWANLMQVVVKSHKNLS
ncbi:hypothetical protein TKK_0008382 [Trichogramma kaykai]